MCVSEAEVKNIVHEELRPVKTQINSARNWAIGVLLALLGTLFAIGAWVGSIDNRVNNVEQDQLRFEERIESKLTRIENLILELNRNGN